MGRFGKYLKCLQCGATRDSKPLTAAGADSSPKSDGDGAQTAAEDEACELCGKPMALKRGRFGQFLGCTGYPECRNIRKISKSGAVAPAPVPVEGTCPVDGAGLMRRFGRFGEFVACANYPECKYVQRETTGVACARPGCKGELIVKKSKRGKTFYGCSEYPKCKEVYWDKPVAEVCPDCNAPFLLEKTTKKGTSKICAREGCGYRSEPAGAGAEPQPPASGARTTRATRPAAS